jgi:hypothetical protein
MYCLSEGLLSLMGADTKTILVDSHPESKHQSLVGISVQFLGWKKTFCSFLRKMSMLNPKDAIIGSTQAYLCHSNIFLFKVWKQTKHKSFFISPYNADHPFVQVHNLVATI